jgi:transcriptional regulator with XRE-family HTH domain
MNDQMITQPQIPALVKSLRQRLGLTQEQLAREVGVTFGTVNQWENGHRRPQPFLLRRLVEMAASLNLVPAPPLHQALPKGRPAVSATEGAEPAATSPTDKFRQLAGLMALGSQPGGTEAGTAEEDEVRERWAQLRRRLGA